MALWELTPVARSDDPNWQGRRQYARVLVRAATAAEARVVASSLDTPDTSPEAGDQHPRLKSGLSDEKLYAATPVDADATDADADGADAVISAEPRDSTEYT